MKFYSYWRSTTSFRVRAALNLKGLAYHAVPVNLIAGEQYGADFVALNPAKGVPTLVLDDGTVLMQSLAIIDYLDAVYPAPKLLPDEPLMRARVMAAAHVVALDIHPVNNLRIVQRLQSDFGATAEQSRAWMVHWMQEGFEALEAMLASDTDFAFGDAPGLADLCIVAQVYNARRWDVDLQPFERLRRVEAACFRVPEIVAASPDNQPDAGDRT
jgi:maleylacetoacetate isomerase/maleylpyruvate isomerase